MNYAFVSTLVPEDMVEELYKISYQDMQDAANALQWHIYNGLSKNLNKNIQLINVLPVASFPQYCKRAYFRMNTFKISDFSEGINIGFCNIKLIRKKSQTKNLYKKLKKWVIETEGEKTIFVYSASAVFLKVVSKLKQNYDDIKICLIIADLPDFISLSSKRSIVVRWFSSYLAKLSYSYMKCVDYYVLLTKQMATYMNINKPFCVMEGISTEENVDDYPLERCKNDLKIIFYSGTLHRKFGVSNLIKAFTTISNQNYRLQICGVGDCEIEIKNMAEKDKRIEFLGRVKRDKVLQLQKNATVLVNPRQNSEEYTKYSFPSKNLEYLSSGVPLIAYKLDGIPDEYDKYIYYVEDDSIESLSNKLIEICELSNEKRYDFGQKAKEYVIKYKNEISQTKKIVDLISNN